jgi:hypothetical protein
MTWNRTASAILAIAYIIIAIIAHRPGLAIETGVFVILPLACIWFSEAMGRYTGLGGLAYGYPITGESPGILVCFMGWIVLLLPIIVTVISYFST